MYESLHDVSKVIHVDNHKVILLEKLGDPPKCVVFNQWGERVGDAVYDCINPYSAYRKLVQPELESLMKDYLSLLFEEEIIPPNTKIIEVEYCVLNLNTPPYWVLSKKSNSRMKEIMHELRSLTGIPWVFEY